MRDPHSTRLYLLHHELPLLIGRTPEFEPACNRGPAFYLIGYILSAAKPQTGTQ
jgi:hypothetical protein